MLCLSSGPRVKTAAFAVCFYREGDNPFMRFLASAGYMVEVSSSPGPARCNRDFSHDTVRHLSEQFKNAILLDGRESSVFAAEKIGGDVHVTTSQLPLCGRASPSAMSCRQFRFPQTAGPSRAYVPRRSALRSRLVRSQLSNTDIHLEGKFEQAIAEVILTRASTRACSC